MTTPETKGMVGWDEIACSVPEPHQHLTKQITVDLSEPHGYFDLAQVPKRLVPPPFEMLIWDYDQAPPWDRVAQQVGMYCPARDAVSETIERFGIWEPSETVAMLCLFEAARNSGRLWRFLDIGAQLGWYSILAEKFALWPEAYEADLEVADVLEDNLRLGQSAAGRALGEPPGKVHRGRIGVDAPGLYAPTDKEPSVIAKVDIEGAEPAAMEMLEPLLEAGKLGALMIELSPVFGVDTDAIIDRMMGDGFWAFFMPSKHEPPHYFDRLGDLCYYDPDVAEYVRAEVAEREQTDLLFVHHTFPGAWTSDDGVYAT